MSHRTKKKVPAWHQPFMAMLPKIVAYARRAFRCLRAEAREEAIQNVVTNAMVAFVRLVQQGKQDVAYPAPLAMYAIRQHLDGRRTGSSLNVNDVLSPHAKKQKGISVKRLDHFDEEEGQWNEILLEDHTAGPAEIARVRLDFGDFLKTLSRRDRKIAKMLATSETTQAVAKKFGVSDGRISQIRKELRHAWQRFVGDEPGPAAVAA